MRILFVCTGNSYRSPVAGALLKKVREDLQVEYIAEVRESRAKYIPLRCDTFRTRGICDAPDDICKRTLHPQGYSLRKLRAAKTEFAAEA